MALAAALSVALGWVAAGASAAPDVVPVSQISVAASPAAQSLRTCADRWNQGSMRGWGPTLVSVVSRPRCIVRLAVHFRRDPRRGCLGKPAVPGHPGFCLDRAGTYACVLDRFGGYACPSNAETAHQPLGHSNGETDAAGFLTLKAASIAGTHRTPPLAWQRRYPHIDGWIYPWTHSGTLKAGLEFEATQHGGCFAGSEQTVAKAALRCVTGVTAIDPCFPALPKWRRPGSFIACPNAPGDTTFTRFLIR